MEMEKYLALGLGTLPFLSNAKTRSISGENPKGEKGAGAKDTPKQGNPAFGLGKGWKVTPCITLKKKSLTILADIKGPGVIQHIWITVAPKAYRNCVLRIYWDNEKFPSIEVPLGDFFANGHGLRYNVNSLPIAVNPVGGFNSYWQMPFRKHCKITIENEYFENIDGFFYQINYSLCEIPDNAAYFHAQWRRKIVDVKNPDHVILDSIKGHGHYVGTFLAWEQLSNGWWGEGEIKFYIDGDKEYPTICGTGTEDYFGGAWCFNGETYSTPFLGYPLYRKEPTEVPKHGLYRWHIFDPIRFGKDLRVTIQSLGWRDPTTYKSLDDDIASVAYWYQAEPHTAFPKMLQVSDRISR
jgi:hypothetical protein